MSFTSGSTLKVLLENGASPNTGPFDIYVNSLSSSGNLVANDVDKTTLSSSGYTFVTPVETFRVWAKSDGSITNADVYVLGEIPGYNKSISVTGSYDGSLTPGTMTASIFLDNGYGLHSGGTVPSVYNTCPGNIGTGTSSINSTYNTTVVVKEHETGSNYILFTVEQDETPTYVYHIPAYSSSGVDVTNIKVCINLSGGGYQTAPTNSVQLYSPASLRYSLVNTDSDGWIIFKSNGVTIFSGSAAGTGSYIQVPGNAFIEITSSILQPGSWGSGDQTPTTNSIDLRFNYNSVYTQHLVYSNNQQQLLSGSTQTNTVEYSFYAMPDSAYSAYITDITIPV